MNFSVTLLCIVAIATQATAFEADAELAMEALIQKHFGDDPPPAAVLSVQGDHAELAKQILGTPYPHATARYRRRGSRSLWVLPARGKTHVFITCFVVDNKKIIASEILAYHGKRGRGILSKRFTRQFLGLSLKRGDRLSERVHGITGATISSKSTINTARLALAWDATVGREKSNSKEQN